MANKVFAVVLFNLSSSTTFKLFSSTFYGIRDLSHTVSVVKLYRFENRSCWNCGKAFIKNSGCNKITCTCGSMMCYLCGNEVKDYNHFGDNK